MVTLSLIKGAELAEGAASEVRLPSGLSRFAIGRDPGNHWALPDPTLAVSARHCEIVATAAGVLLRDLSTNGTFVNGNPTRLTGEHRLQDGDRITLGPYVLELRGLRAPSVALADLPTVAIAPPAAAPRGMSARGGDPAAMLASGAGHERVGLTEMLRNAPPAEDSGLEMTKIRAAPRVASAAAATPKPTPASAAAAAAAAATSLFAANSPAAEAWLRQLASGLGLAPEALAGCDPAQAAERAGAVARAAVAVLQRWLQQQPGGAPTGAGLALSADELALLRQAHTPEAALLALMAARPAGAKP